MSRPLPCGVDLAVIGGGILGLAVARELGDRHPDADICLLEASRSLASGQSGHSSGVIHAGVYYEPGSLKSRLCVEGARDLYAYLGEKGIEHRRPGKLIVATKPAELTRLDELERKATANRVPGLARIPGEAIPGIEPNARGLAALHSPQTGTVDFTLVAAAYAADFEAGGGTICTGQTVTSVNTAAAGLKLTTPSGSLIAGRAVFCAGLQADRLARLCGATEEPRIVPFLGSYLVVDDRPDLVRGNVYPVPDPDLPFLGAHLTPTPAGSLTIGPTALMVAARDAYRPSRIRWPDLLDTLSWPGAWKLGIREWRAALLEVRHAIHPNSIVREAARMVPALGDARIVAGPSGVRAQALSRDGRLVDDFVLEETERALHVRNAPSPAATSSLALARLIADRLDRTDRPDR